MAKPPDLLICFYLLLPLLPSSSAVDFVYNGFDSSNVTLYGTATINKGILILTDETTFVIGRAFYKSKIPTKSQSLPFSPISFSTSFIFSIAPSSNGRSGHGFAFLFAPSPSSISNASSAQNLGLFNGSNNGIPENHILAVEFDVFQNAEFRDIDANHVGINVNSLTSLDSHTAGFWANSNNSSFVEKTLNNGVNYQAWIDYNSSHLNISMARAGSDRPSRPLLSTSVDLADVFLDEMYVGFSASTGELFETHRILAWSFSNSNFSAYRALVTSNLPSFLPKKESIFKSKGFIAGMSIGSVLLVGFLTSLYCILVRGRNKQRRDEEEDNMEEWELEYWPHRIGYSDIYSATKGFSEENMIGMGGNGKVYRGVLGAGEAEIAVKCIPQGSEQGMKEFLAEVSSLGRLKHRNLVGLVGWCRRERQTLILIYEYMENGSLDKRIFDCSEDLMLDWGARIRILKDVGNGVLYLHEGWEVKVLHRDIKSSNVMLDKEMIGRLGDFGLARMHPHGQALGTTRVVGTVGYMAPEVVRSGKASTKTDVFGFGILILEVACGRRPVEEGKEPLMQWVWSLMERGEVGLALDPKLRAKGAYDVEEVERILHLGLVCSHPDPSARPTMRQAMKILDGPPSETEQRERGGESMDTYLLASEPVWFGKYDYKRWSHQGKAHYPTLDDVRQSQSSSISLSSSDIILEGR